MDFLKKIFTNINEVPVIPGTRWLATSVITISFMLIVEWVQRNKDFGLQINTNKLYKILVIDYFILMMMFVFGNFGANQFIYFQF